LNTFRRKNQFRDTILFQRRQRIAIQENETGTIKSNANPEMLLKSFLARLSAHTNSPFST
jgi:hypothetical protein